MLFLDVLNLAERVRRLGTVIPAIATQTIDHPVDRHVVTISTPTPTAYPLL
jgi:hypothetical protein